MIHHITRATRHLIFWSLIVTAIGLTGVRLTLSGIEGYKASLTDYIGDLLGAPVKIGRLGARMRGFSPELVLTDIDIASDVTRGKSAIELKEIRLGIDLLDVLVSRKLLSSSWVTLVGAKISVKRKADGSYAIVGLKASDSNPLWLLQGGRYEVLDSDIVWQDEQKNGRPLIFESVDLAVINQGDRHRINVLMALPKKYGDALTVSLDFTGNLYEPKATEGRAYIKGRNIRFPEWVTTELPLDIGIATGSGDFEIWLDWRHSRLASIAGSAQVAQLKLTRPDAGALPVNNLKSRFHLRLNGKRWRLDANEFLLETADPLTGNSKKWPDAVFSLAGVTGGDKLLKQIALYAEQLDLQEASTVLQFFTPLADERAKLLRQVQLKGMLQDFSLFAVPETRSVAVNGKFANLAAATLFSIPGLDNLSGEVRGDEQHGVARLTAEDAHLTAPELFREPVTIDRLEGMLAWRQRQDDWAISSSLIELNSRSFKSKNRLRVNIPKTEGQVFMDLQSSFACEDATAASHYLPAKIMDPVVVDWLDHAFIKGRIPQGGLLFSGKLEDFPFTGGTGVFEALFDVEQMELAYHPSWPHLTDVAGEILFFQNGFSAALRQGFSSKVKINNAGVAIPALDTSEHLLIQGELEGQVGDALAFLQQTPLSSRVDKLLEATAPEGDAQVTLDLKIPLYEGAEAKVDGSAELNNARLLVKSLDLQVDQVQGQIRFNEQGVYSDTIKAQALGNPIKINIKSADRQTLVNVTGHAGISDLQQQFKMPWWRIAEGSTDYQLQVRLPYDQHTPELYVQSNLAGVALDLPEALAKRKDQQRSLSLTFDLADKFLLPLELNYDNELKAAVNIDVKQQGIVSGHVLVGTGKVAQRNEQGLKLEINRERLVLKDWLGMSAAQDKEGGKVPDISEIKVQSEHVLWNTTDLGRFDLALQRRGDSWDGQISSPVAMGKLKVPFDLNGQQRIILDLDTLNISAFKQFQARKQEPETQPAPETFPLLSVTSNNTLWQSVQLGKLVMETERIPNGMAIKRMELAGEDEKLALTGDWKVSGNRSVTQTRGRLEMHKAGPLLAQLGISKDLTDTSAVVDFSVNWPAPPYQFSLADLQGHADVNFKSGRILSIEPGFGRVLGILAMAQWIKRLQLDFSDVYEEGLTFNSIKGRFDLADGKAKTQNLVVDAVPAKITISGETDFINQTVDHIVNVAPKSAEAVPIAGTIMGKVAALVDKSLTGVEHAGFFFGSQYLVKGKWGNAQISPLHENDGLLQKTWNGITDFPWVNQRENK